MRSADLKGDETGGEITSNRGSNLWIDSDGRDEGEVVFVLGRKTVLGSFILAFGIGLVA